MSNRLRSLWMLALAVLLAAGLAAPDARASDVGQYLELLRQDIKVGKVALMTEFMNLTPEQGEIFWPLYREFQNELSKLGDRQLALIKQYAEHIDAMTPEVAEDIAKQHFKLEKDNLKLLERTHKKVSKQLDAIVANRFVQLETRMQAMIDMQISAELPLFE